MAWDDLPLDEVVAKARAIVPRESLLPHVPALVPAIQIEALFPHGTVLVHVGAPFGPAEAGSAGSVRPRSAELELAAGRSRATASLRNTGAMPIWVSSHVPVDSLNRALEVDLDQPGRFRLDVPAGVSVKVDPGQVRRVGVVEMLGGSS